MAQSQKDLNNVPEPNAAGNLPNGHSVKISITADVATILHNQEALPKVVM